MIHRKDLSIPSEQDIFWNEWRLNPKSTAYNISLAYELNGALNEEKLVASIESLINTHHIFKFFFLEKDGRLYIQQLNNLGSYVDIIDVANIKNDILNETINLEINKIRQYHFNLEKGSLFKIALIKVSNSHYFLVLCFHHILIDGLSEQYIIDYISAYYNETPRSLAKPLSINSYLDLRKSLLDKVNQQNSRCFWEKEVSKIDPEGNEFSAIRSEERKNSKNGEYVYFDIDRDLVRELKALIDNNQTTWLCILMAAYVITLHRLSNCEQLTICYATDSRPKELKNTIGCFINILPLPIKIEKNITFLDVLREITNLRSQQKEHQLFPFLEIIKELRNNKGVDIQSSLTVGLIQTHTKTTGIVLDDIIVNPISELHNEAIYNICLEYEFIDNAIFCRLNYLQNYFDENIIKNFKNHFFQTLKCFLNPKNQYINDFSLLDNLEKRKLLLNWNNTKINFNFDISLPELISTHISKTPNKTALIFRNESLSYKELEERVTQIGSHLYSCNRSNNRSIIPIILPNSINRPIAMLSVLKSGSAYVPIDPEYPAQRIATILQDCEPKQLITSVCLQDKINNAISITNLKGVKICLIEDLGKDSILANNLPKIKPEDSAYIIYTSGSTGVPKGVKISHKSLLNFLFAMKKLLAFNSDDCFINITPYTFDIAGLEIYLPLMAGACCVIADDRSANNGNLLSSLIDKYNVNFVQTTPTKWQLLIDTGWQTKQNPTLLCGGEAFPNVLVDKLLSMGNKVWNMYGPTETTIWSTAYELRSSEKLAKRSIVPIGKPVANTQVYILDRYYQPVPVGCIGELYIGGDGVALGYFKRDDLTQKRFIVKPISLEPVSSDSKFRKPYPQLLYKTGDSAKWLPDGNLICLGRYDYQIKHHGYRIELTEIEETLLKYQEIKQAVVVRKNTLPSNQHHLIAYYTLHDNKKSLLENNLRKYLFEHLPVHCVPSYFYKLQKLPLTSSGKIDRNQLSQSEFTTTEKNEIEQSNLDNRLTKIWQNALHVNQINAKSNFFSLGGNSLSAIHIAYNIEKTFSIECSAKIIFNNPDFQQLSMWIIKQPKKLTQQHVKEIKKTERTSPIPLSSQQKRFWFLSNVSPPGSYNILLAWKLKGNLNINNLIKTINKLRENHEIFRTIYKRNGSNISQYIIPYKPTNIEIKLVNQEELNLTIAKEKIREFCLAKEPPFKVQIFCVSNDYYALTINMHHIIFDEQSINILIKKISQYYEYISINKINLCDKDEIQYADYAIWEKIYSQDIDSNKTINFWRNELSRYETWFLPTDYQRSEITNLEASIYEFKIEGKDIATLLPITSKYKATLFSVFLSTVCILLSKFSVEEDLFVWLPTSLRESKELENTIGCFINTLPLRYKISSNMSLVDSLVYVQENLFNILNHKRVSFDTLTKYFKTSQKNSGYLNIPVLITWENDADKSNLNFKEVIVERIETLNFSTKADLHFNFIEGKNGIDCRIEYVSSLYKKETIETLSKKFLQIIADFTSNPNKPIYNDTSHKEQKLKKLTNRNDENFTHTVKNKKIVSGDFIEENLTKIFEKLLKIRIKNIHDNFFDLGINSLLLLQVQAEMEKVIGLNKEIKIIDFFKHPSIADLANYLEDFIEEDNSNLTLGTNSDSNNEINSNDIAIIGLSGEFPGAKNIEQFWENLCKNQESISHFSDKQLEQFGIPQKIIEQANYIKSKGVIENAEYFDAKFFNMSPNEATLTDPQQRLLIEHTWTAIEMAGYSTPKYKGCIGVYTGSDESNYVTKILKKNASCLDSVDDFQTLIANGNAFLSTKISYKLNLTGPSLNINTACSTGLVVVAIACQQLLDKQCDMAVAGAASVKQPQKTGYFYQKEGITSADGHCRPFSKDADGTVPSAGVGVVLLKRLTDAVRDKDHIHAVIKGYHINNDGSNKAGYTAPSIYQQAKCVSSAIDTAKINSDTIQYVEMHGTGTKIGDPIEVAALSEGFRNTTSRTGFCAIGSVKSNIGHADAAAGMAGLIKTIQALKNKIIPATLNCKQPNDTINLQDSAFYINDKTVPWKSSGTKRRAGINSLGLGGTNAFLVLEEPPITKKSKNKNSDHYILPFSAKTPSALSTVIKNFYNYIVEETHKNYALDKTSFLKDIAHTLQLGRYEFQYRDYVVTNSILDLTNQLKFKMEASTKEQHNYSKAVKNDIIFFFPGQGSQYKGVEYALYKAEPVFKDAVDECVYILDDYLKIDFKPILFPILDDKSSNKPSVDDREYGELAIFCVEYALAKLWGSYGIQPVTLIGNSFGEYLAAHITGIFSLEDILKVIIYRAELIRQLPHDKISAINTTMMEKVVPDFIGFLEGIRMNQPTIPIISSLTRQFSSDIDMTVPEYWAKHLISTICPSATIKISLDIFTSPLFITIGSEGKLKSLLNSKLLDDGKILEVNTLKSTSQYKVTQTENAVVIYQALAKLWSTDTRQIIWDKLSTNVGARRIPLPTYPFERKPYWPDTSNNKQENLSLLKNSTMEDWFYRPSWQRLESINSIVNKDFTTSFEDCWIVFIENSAIGKILKTNINHHLKNVIYVTNGEEFAKRNKQEFVINPGKEEDYTLLINNIIAVNEQPYYILNFWAYEKNNGHIDDVLNKSFYHLFHLSKTLVNKLTEQSIYIINIAKELFSVFEEDSVCPAITSFTAIAEVIQFEKPNIKIKYLDVADEQEIDIPTLVKTALFEIKCLINKNDYAQLAYRKGYRWQKEFINIKLSTIKQCATQQSPLNNDGVYLVIGGTSGIGLEIAKKLILEQHLHLVLLSRKIIPDKNLWKDWLNAHSEDDENFNLIKLLNSIYLQGGNFDVISADVTSLASMQIAVKKINKKIGSIKGIIHSAGVFGSGLIANKSKTMIEKLLSSKLQGLYVLSKLFKDIQLDFVFFFSSITSVTGGIGQLEYCAANTCLDSLPNADLFHKNTRILITNWNRWENTGMATFTKLEKNSGFSEDYEKIINHNSITKEQGYEVFTQVINSYENQLIISKFPLQDYKKMLMNAAKQMFEHVGDSKKIIVNELNSPESKIIALLKSLLGLNTLDINDNFFDLGGHSLMALQMLSKIKKEFGVDLLISDVYQAKNIKNFIEFVTKKQLETLSSSYIIPMRKSGDEPPLFLIHPVGGAVFCYLDLVKILRYNGPIYAIQDPGLTSENYNFTTLESMANFYLKDVQSICPDGPYRLAGFSLGGTIAFEMAYELIRKGFSIEYLGLIDSWAVFYDYDKDEFEKSMKRQLELFKSDIEKIGHSDFTSLLSCQLSRMNLLKKYKPKTVNFDLHLYKANEVLPQYANIQEKNNHWQPYTYCKVKTSIIPGSHETILKKQNVSLLADLMSQHLALIACSKNLVQN